MGGGESSSAELEKLERRLGREKAGEARKAFLTLSAGQAAFDGGRLAVVFKAAFPVEGVDSWSELAGEIFECFLKVAVKESDNFAHKLTEPAIDLFAFLLLVNAFARDENGFVARVLSDLPGSPEDVLMKMMRPFVSKSLCYSVVATFHLVRDTEAYMTTKSGRSEGQASRKVGWDSSMVHELMAIMPAVHEHVVKLCSPTGLVPSPSSPAAQSDLEYKTLPKDASLMADELAWFLSPMLRARPKWTQVYNSDKSGKAWPTFLATVIGRKHTLVIVKDKRGAVFGGMGGASWDKWAKFDTDTAGHGSCLFSLLPSARVYTCTGWNSNFQYLASGCNSGINPNGIGWGGQVGHFGLFLDAGLDTGHSYASATFNNTALTGDDSRFEIDELEVWTASSEEDEQENGGQARGTVLRNHKFAADKKILEFAGVFQTHRHQHHRD